MEFLFWACSLARKTALSSLVTGGREFKLMFSREVVLDPGIPMSTASLPAGLTSGALALRAGKRFQKNCLFILVAGLMSSRDFHSDRSLKEKDT